MFITPAFAQTAVGGDGGFLIQLVPFLLIFIILYFLIIRPQQRRAKDHQAMIAAVRRGDMIVTSGGLIGKIAKVIDDHEISVEIATGVKVKITRGSIAEVRSKTEPANDDTPAKPAKKPRATKSSTKTVTKK